MTQTKSLIFRPTIAFMVNAMTEESPVGSGWTRLASIFLIVLLALLALTIIYGYLFGIVWAVGIGLLYVVFQPLIFFINLRTQRYKMLLITAVQFAIILPIFWIFVTFADTLIGPIPELYTTALIVFALTILFAAGALYIVFDRILRPRFVAKPSEEPSEP
jgi:prepilin signal peptidase PulO-like enzyme (type II secretory pathway)